MRFSNQERATTGPNFGKIRPDGLAFDKGKQLQVLLEYTRAMDTNEDWAEKKEQEKNHRYSSLLGFINHLSHREKSGWKAFQTNFTTGVRGSLHTNQLPLKPTLQLEYEVLYTQTSSSRDWSRSG